MSRVIKLIVIHCSATPANRDITEADIERMHKARGFRTTGYHDFIRRDGQIERGRQDDEMGAHVAGFNRYSIGICMAGGLDEADPRKSECNFTKEQWSALHGRVLTRTQQYPGAVVCGHRDLSPDLDRDGIVEPHEWLKDCPTFDAQMWWYGKRIGIPV